MCVVYVRFVRSRTAIHLMGAKGFIAPAIDHRKAVKSPKSPSPMKNDRRSVRANYSHTLSACAPGPLSRKRTVCFLIALALLASQSARAASETWLGTSGSSGNWGDSSNWSNSIVSGSTGTTTDPDTATFNAAITGSDWGISALNPVVINSASQNIKNINFDTNAGAYFIGSTVGNPLYLTASGTTQILSTFAGASTTETINAPLVLEGNYTFANNVTSVASDNLVFGGNITNAATSTLIISGPGTSTGNQISGNISNGTGTQGVSITTTAGAWTLSGSNNYSGGTTINGAGGTTILSGVNSSAGTTTLTAGTLQLNNTTANDGGLASGALSFAGGNLVVGSAGALTLTNAVNMSNGTTISGAQSLTFSGTFTNTQAKILTNSLTGGSILTFGSVNLGSGSTSALSLTLNGAGNTTFGGVVEDYSGGVGTSHSSLNIDNSGTTTFSGANTYGGTTTIATTSNSATVIFAGSNNSAGATTVNQGILQFDNASNGGIASGLLTLAPSNGGTLVELQSLVAAPTVSNAIALAGNTTVNGANGITLAGTLSVTGATVTLTNSITGGNTLTLSGANLNIDQVTGTAQTLVLSGSGNTTISSAIEDYSGGTGSVGGIFTITNTATTTLSGANTYSGLTTISGAGATVIMAGSNSSAGALTLSNATATLQLDNAANGGIASGLLTLTSGTLQSLVSALTLSNTVTLGGSVTINGANGITLSGVLSEGNSDTLTSSITGGNRLTLSGTALNIDAASGAAKTFTIAGSGNTTINSVMQDYSGGAGTSHGSFTITNTATTTLTGANTYGGTTTVNAGTLQLNMNLGGALASTSALTFGGGNFQIIGASGVTSTQTLGTLTMSVNTNGSITLTSTGGGGVTLTLGNTWTRNAASTLNINLSAANTTLAASPAVTNSIVVGAGTPAAFATVTDSVGTGFATVNGSSDVVRYTGAAILGSSSNSSTTNFVTEVGDAGYSGSTLTMATAGRTLNTLQLNTTPGTGVLDLGGASDVLALTDQAILVTGTNSFTIQDGQIGASGKELIVHQFATGSLTFAGTVSASSGSLTKDGSGMLILTAADTYTGETTVDGGTMEFVNETSLYNDTTSSWTASNIFVTRGATLALEVGGAGQFVSGDIGTLAAIGSSTGGFESGSILGLDTTGGNFTYGAAIANTNSGANVLGLAKLGSNMLTLSANNTYTGATSVTGGTLFVSGSLSGSSSTSVTNATLAGTGSITGPVTIGNGLGGTATATIEVGLTGTTGTLSTGALTLNSDAVYKFNLNPTLGTSDLLNVNGSITLGSGVATLSGNVLSDEILSGGQVFDIANSTGGITGYFAGLTNGSTYLLGDNSYIINYGTVVSDEITLTAEAIPEPGTWAMMLGGLGMLVSFQRMRRHSRRSQ